VSRCELQQCQRRNDAALQVAQRAAVSLRCKLHIALHRSVAVLQVAQRCNVAALQTAATLQPATYNLPQQPPAVPQQPPAAPQRCKLTQRYKLPQRCDVATCRSAVTLQPIAAL